MRPNRIGAWPKTLNALVDTAASAVEQIEMTSAARFMILRTVRNEIELICGIEAINDTIYSRTLWYSTNHVCELTETIPRISFGGFLTASGIREVNVDPQPLYVRMVGHATICLQENNSHVLLQPIIGIKKTPAAPVQSHTNEAKETRELSVATVLPIRHQSHHLNENHVVQTAHIDETFLLGSSFSRFGGVGFPGDTIFGVGWSVLQPDITSDASAHLMGYSEFSMSAWIYTADIDVYDPNKS